MDGKRDGAELAGWLQAGGIVVTPGQYAVLPESLKVIHDVGMEIVRQLKRIADALEDSVEDE